MPSISPEHWHYIPFATNIDPYGGKSVPLEKVELKPFSLTKDTSRGELQMRYVEGKFNLLAVDLGIGLLYDKEGILETVGVDITQYCDNLDEDDLEKMGGEGVLEMLEMMAINGDRIYLSAELKDKTVAIASINEYSGERKVIFSVADVDFGRRNLVTMNYEGHTLFVGLSNDVDEFEIGVMAKEGTDAPVDREMSLLITVICSDCNYKTYLEGRNEDRFERLAKRVFN